MNKSIPSLIALCIMCAAAAGLPQAHSFTVRVTWVGGRSLEDVFGAGAFMRLVNSEGEALRLDPLGFGRPSVVPGAWVGRSHEVGVYLHTAAGSCHLADGQLTWFGAGWHPVRLDIGEVQMRARLGRVPPRGTPGWDLLLKILGAAAAVVTGWLTRAWLRRWRLRRRDSSPRSTSGPSPAPSPGPPPGPSPPPSPPPESPPDKRAA